MQNMYTQKTNKQTNKKHTHKTNKQTTKKKLK